MDQAALDEFYSWVNLVGLDHRTSIIHGIPYREPEWLQMSSASASLIWSPTSNLTLYGETAQIPAALDAGVNIALAPDWTESGSLNLMMELRAAMTINQEHWDGQISDQQLVKFVTCNAALALGIQDRVGQITPGFQADLMVISPVGMKWILPLKQAGMEILMKLLVPWLKLDGLKRRRTGFPSTIGSTTTHMQQGQTTGHAGRLSTI